MDDVPRLLVLLLPPFPEEGRLDVDEAAVLVPDQLLNHRVDDVLDAGFLNIRSKSVEVLVDGLRKNGSNKKLRFFF